uniref:Uncharacterized protein n=1 Tax=Rhizophora mucronata TaxID=61149 RepID=A0A2P2NCG4_RHIMU
MSYFILYSTLKYCIKVIKMYAFQTSMILVSHTL